MRRYIATLALACMAAGLAGLGQAEAAVKSKTTILFADYNYPTDMAEDFFTGDISSVKKACVRNRLIKVFRQVDGPDQLVGSTNKTLGWSKPPPGEKQFHGGWQLEIEDPGSGRYYAEMKKKSPCRGDTSKTLRVRDDPNV